MRTSATLTMRSVCKYSDHLLVQQLVIEILYPNWVELIFVIVLLSMMVIGVIGNTLVVAVVVSKRSMVCYTLTHTRLLGNLEVTPDKQIILFLKLTSNTLGSFQMSRASLPASTIRLEGARVTSGLEKIQV